MDSILTSIKKSLEVTAECTHFDHIILMHINSVLMILTQLGVGPSDGFVVTDESDCWTDFIDEPSKLQAVKSYVYLKVKLLFDPPLSSAVMESMNRMISELEWRLNAEAESA